MLRRILHRHAERFQAWLDSVNDCYGDDEDFDRHVDQALAVVDGMAGWDGFNPSDESWLRRNWIAS